MAIRENVKVTGLTGMSGAGKSTACKIFRKSGFEIIDCDMICREIVKRGSSCLGEIVKVFGDGILTADGTLNRKAMGRIIFSQKEKRLTLNGIMYPYVSYIVIKRIFAAKNKLVMLDAPTLFESGIDDICDCAVSIVAERETLISRIVSRDSIDRESAERRLDAQHNAEYYIKRSDYVIHNDKAPEELIESVIKTVHRIKESK